MTVHTLPDIVGLSTAPLAATQKRARWILFTATGSTAASVADSTTDATHGSDLVPNVPVLYPENGADPTDTYKLDEMTAYVPSGTTLTITYGL
jgi:hypothetical protein